MPKPKPDTKNTEFKVDPAKLQGEIDQLNQLKKAVDERNGKLRAKIKLILETKGYHSQALAIVRKIDKMSETEMADFMRSFKPMFDELYEAYWKVYVATDLLASVENVVPIDGDKK